MGKKVPSRWRRSTSGQSRKAKNGRRADKRRKGNEEAEKGERASSRGECVLKKVGGDRKEAVLSETRYHDRFTAISELSTEENLSVQLLCDIAEVSRQGYYKWRKRRPSVREKLNQRVMSEITLLQRKLKGIYGYRRMTMSMNRIFKEPLNHKRILRLMKRANLLSIIRRKKRRYKYSSPLHTAENVLNREFQADRPNEKWVTDVTEMKYGNRKAYLSAIMDLHDGSVISYVLGKSNNNDLVFKTLRKALKAAPNSKALIHSDRGFQYTSRHFKRMVDKAKMKQSMSRVGRCIDKGPMESFWGKLKCEKYRLGSYQSFEELQKDIYDYIQFYNHDRYQEKLNGLSPCEYRAKAA
ncbi:IS3 family transposase [Salipaludibacillus aurantiacus]|nr:IS3 family transposase [Salipaludibacillus aurantiacus]